MLRYSVDQIGLPGTSFAEDVRFLADLGVPAVGVLRTKLQRVGADEAARMIADAGLGVSVLLGAGGFVLEDPSSWAAEVEDVRRAVDEAATLDASVLLINSGPAGSLRYDEAEERFLELVAQLLRVAERADVVLALEPNHALRVDLGYVHSLHDGLDLADTVDSPYFTVVAEVNNCWIERHLYADIAQRCGRVGLVQINDFAAGTLTTPERVPLGDGIIPLERFIGAFEQAGYDGYYDIEVLGPAVTRLGGDESTRRSVAYLERLHP